MASDRFPLIGKIHLQMAGRVNDEVPEIVVNESAAGSNFTFRPTGQFADLPPRPVRRLQCFGVVTCISARRAATARAGIETPGRRSPTESASWWGARHCRELL